MPHSHRWLLLVLITFQPLNNWNTVSESWTSWPVVIGLQVVGAEPPGEDRRARQLRPAPQHGAVLLPGGVPHQAGVPLLQSQQPPRLAAPQALPVRPIGGGYASWEGLRLRPLHLLLLQHGRRWVRTTRFSRPVRLELWLVCVCMCVCMFDSISSVVVVLLQASGFTVTTPNSTCAQWRRFAALRPTSSSTPNEYLRTKTGHYRGTPRFGHFYRLGGLLYFFFCFELCGKRKDSFSRFYIDCLVNAVHMYGCFFLYFKRYNKVCDLCIFVFYTEYQPRCFTVVTIRWRCDRRGFFQKQL